MDFGRQFRFRDEAHIHLFFTHHDKTFCQLWCFYHKIHNFSGRRIQHGPAGQIMASPFTRKQTIYELKSCTKFNHSVCNDFVDWVRIIGPEILSSMSQWTIPGGSSLERVPSSHNNMGRSWHDPIENYSNLGSHKYKILLEKFKILKFDLVTHNATWMVLNL